jgi:hypothetical protein
MKEFDEILFDSINSTLTDLLGAESRDIIFSDIEARFSIPKEQVPAHIDVFSKDLRDIFGQKETVAISRVVAKRLYAALQITFVNHIDLDLVRCVDEAKAARRA